MATRPRLVETEAKEPKADEDLEKEANERLKQAQRQKAWRQQDIREAYFFAAAQRNRQVVSTTRPYEGLTHDEGELQTDLAMELCTDFVTEVVNTYMPEAQLWCERGRGMFVPSELWEQIQQEVRDGDKRIFEAIKASNLYAELPKAFNPDLAIGTTAMWIRQQHPSKPITVTAIPIRELEVNLGPEGEIDDRFCVRWTRNRYVKTLLPEVKTLPRECEQRIKDLPDGLTDVRWGYWRKWDRVDDEVWQHVAMIGRELVHKATVVGEGSCPLIAGRFDPSADWAWGIGPMLKALPSLRQIDELEGAMIENIDLALRPPIHYPDDSYAQIEQGLEPGMAYPVLPGRGQDVGPIYQVPPPDQAKYAYEDKARRLRKMFFTDFPEQTGDTPPTLGQWLDELARAQRRIGTPGLPFWREICMPIFLRFKYLLEVNNVITPVKVDGKNIALRPYNPTQRAAEQQEIATAMQFLNIAAAAFPEEYRLVVDGRKTLDALIQKMRVSDQVKTRTQEDVQAALGTISQLIVGRQRAGEAELPEAAGAPAAA